MIDLTKLNITERRKTAGEQSLYRNDARKSGHVDGIEETITEERFDLVVSYKLKNSEHKFIYDATRYKKAKKFFIRDCKLDARHKMAYMLYGKDFSEISYKLMDFLTIWYPNADMDMVKNRNFDIKRETLKLKVMFDAILGKIRLPIRIKDEDIQDNS